METIGRSDTREGQTGGDLHPNREEKESEGKFGYEHAEIDATIDECAGLFRKVEVGVEFSNIWTDFEKSRAERYVHADKNRNQSTNRWGAERNRRRRRAKLRREDDRGRDYSR